MFFVVLKVSTFFISYSHTKCYFRQQRSKNLLTYATETLSGADPGGGARGPGPPPDPRF